MTGNEPRTSNAPISIQPKPSNHTLENFLQAVQFNTVVIPSVQDNTVDQSNENTPLQGHINGNFNLLSLFHCYKLKQHLSISESLLNLFHTSFV
jgi:hypothetical protein